MWGVTFKCRQKTEVYVGFVDQDVDRWPVTRLVGSVGST